jgi:hypothetical protein
LLPDALTARSSNGSGCWPLKPATRVRIPYGLLETTDQVVQLVDTRRSERRARAGLGVRLSPWSLGMWCRRGWRPIGFHKAGVPVRFRGLQLNLIRRRWASARRRLITFACQVQLLDLPLHGRVRKREKRPVRETGDSVGSTPTSATCGPVVKRHDTSPTCWRRWFNSIRDHSLSVVSSQWSVGADSRLLSTDHG